MFCYISSCPLDTTGADLRLRCTLSPDHFRLTQPALIAPDPLSHNRSLTLYSFRKALFKTSFSASALLPLEFQLELYIQDQVLVRLKLLDRLDRLSVHVCLPGPLPRFFSLIYTYWTER